ncbi:hypothetical protein Dsin_023970 [Dipteronia sinensis]|uniref:Uncharacterized protein n=1 Tax=Dipteronia sinensis TaxID=43782 RepID=A0AAE0A4X2_9ROSI|nr:hypothetical protein Dsin_023970 [Dipteronia sinensis]
MCSRQHPHSYVSTSKNKNKFSSLIVICLYLAVVPPSFRHRFRLPAVAFGRHQSLPTKLLAIEPHIQNCLKPTFRGAIIVVSSPVRPASSAKQHPPPPQQSRPTNASAESCSAKQQCRP